MPPDPPPPNGCSSIAPSLTGRPLSASLRSVPERDSSLVEPLLAQNADCVPQDIPLPYIHSPLRTALSPVGAVSSPSDLDAPRCCVPPALSLAESWPR